MKRRNRGLVFVLAAMVSSSMTALATSKTSDLKLQVEAQDKLFHAKVGEMVIVRVEDGVATLEGTVESVGRKSIASKQVKKVDGISRVEEKIEVRAGMDDARVLAEAGKQIRRYSFYTIFDHIALGVRDGNLTLTGFALHPWRKEDVGRIVAMVPGVRTVTNSIEVLPVSPMDSEVRLRVARAIYADPTLSKYAIQANPPIHIVVKNGNVTLSGVVHSTIEKALAERAARFAATFFNLDNQLQVELEMAKARS